MIPGRRPGRKYGALVWVEGNKTWGLPSLKLTASLPLKMDDWKTIRLPSGALGPFSGANLLLVLGRVKICQICR